MGDLYRNYVWLFNDLADDRVKDWFLMGGPIPIVFILSLYIYMIKVGLPVWMKDRPPFSLKTIIRWYNVFQVVANSVLFWKMLTSGWTTTLTLGCVMPRYDDDPEAVSMVTWMWWTIMLKVIELVETVFFVLRKKDNQASFLHVYHHIITVLVLWIAVKYVGGGMASLTPMLNSFVHIIMYAYYLVSAEAGPKLRVKLNKWKMWLTVLQMTQFTILLLHSLQALAPSCPAPRVIVWIYIPNVVVVYYLFYDFFRNTYFKKPAKVA